MSDLPTDLANIELSEDIFKGIKFFISGEVPEKIIDLLKSGGAERLNYFSDYVTHLIVGENSEENDIVDANDVYEIPALTPKWVVICASLKRLVSTKSYLHIPGGKLLSNLVFCFSNIREDLKYLWALITYNGGIVQLNLNKNCNYLVATETSGIKYEKAESLGPEIIKIVTPDWVVETIRDNALADATLFHPKLINWPKPVKHESTTAITGFEPEQTESTEKVEEKCVSDSTQALLEKLKQRMPWNQPSTPKSTSASDPIAPPNVVAPSFTQKVGQQSPRLQLPSTPLTPQPQQITPQSPVSSSFSPIPRSPSSLPNQQIPRSIVHHTPTQQQSSFQQQPNPLNISRLLNQQQTRPNIQQLRGQLGQSQLHQQLLQQRIQQSQQNIIQRNSSGQITIQQQLLQQQLVQGQRQLLQNQLNQGQMMPQQQQGSNQQSSVPQQIGTSQHMGQLTQQQIAQLQQQQLQLKQNQMQQQQAQLNQNQQQIQLNQNQQLLQSQVLQQQQNQMNQQQQQNQMNQQQQNQLNPQQPSQLSQQQQTQLNTQQSTPQIQMSQSQSFVQQTINQHLASQQQQQLLQQKQQFLSQQQAVTSQQQIIHSQPNLAIQQQQFVSQSFNQNQNVNQEINQQNSQQQQQVQQQQQQGINQQNLNQQQGLNQMNAQALNQQLNSQNLGPQLNQQQLNQQLNQQNQLNQQLTQQNLLNQQLNPQTSLGQQEQLNQQLNQQNQLSQQQLNQINQQNQLSQQSINQQTLEQNINQTLNQQLTQGLSQQLQQQQLNRQSLQQQQLTSQQNLSQQLQQQGLNSQNLQQQQQIPQVNQQINPGLPQQVVRTQFQQTSIGQQILLNQQSSQNPPPQRAQINQHLWAQQPSQVPGQQIIRQPVNVVQQGAPRVQWSANPQQGNVVPQRQFIQLDARTHNELQKMPPEQQALFVAKLQRQRQFLKQVQQRGGGGSHILIRGNVPPGLTTQQQVQWLQQQAKQQGIVLPPNIQQQNITPGTLTQPGIAQNIPHAPGLSPINQNNTQFNDQNQQQQLQLRQYRLQQLQLQREQAQKNHSVQQQQGAIPQPTIVRPIGQPQLADSTTNPPQVQDGNIHHPLVVNAKTKTALANMLSIKLQSGGSSIGVQRPETIPEPSAAGTLRLMTAQHNAALNSKPQEIIALQRRNVSGPNGEIIKTPGTPQLPITPTNDPPKLQYCPKPALPLQHRPGPFYGHNPNLKLPPDLFLLGCIFVVVELDNFLEEHIPGWQKKIEKHGGEVEKQYCSRVTHVLCETQRHGVVMQALRDCKRCVTILWLSDVMDRKQVLPPWTALHLPSIYLDTAPASKHLISISGFEGSERNRVKQMIKNTGAKCTSYFSKHNTLLISAKADGRKNMYAKKWQIPVVNVQWLTDIMLGNFTAMNQMDHQLYQQYSSPPNFSFDPKLVPNLMLAWKAPINISQESYERVKRSASPVVLPKKAKKQKTEPTDENDNISEDVVTNSTHRILFSMITDTKDLQKMIRELGGTVAKDQTDFTHLVMPYLARSNKLFFAIVKGALVVSEQWLKDSFAANQFLPENNYNLNSKDFNYHYKCDIDQTLQTRNRNKLFEGKFFFVTPSVFPSKKVVVELIQSCGGIVERVRRSSAQIEATSINSPYSYFIITHENDLHLVADLLKNKKDKMRIVCNAELIFSAILKQTFEVEPYAVCVL